MYMYQVPLYVKGVRENFTFVLTTLSTVISPTLLKPFPRIVNNTHPLKINHNNVILLVIVFCI